MSLLLTIIVLLHFALTIDGNKDRFSALQPEKNWKITETRQSYPGCWLGEKFYKLGDKFNPEIQPRGRIYCIICQCVPITKKGIVQQNGNIKCKDLKSKCPRPKCSNPQVFPGKCCKSCSKTDKTIEDDFTLIPGHLTKEIDKILSSDDKHRVKFTKFINKKFVALLVGRNVIGKHPIKTRGVAVVHLFVTKEFSVQFSIRFDELEKPEKLQLTDKIGNVLLESNIRVRNPDKKICDEWEKFPRYYFRHLQKGKLMLVITTSKYKDGEVAGIPEVDRARQLSTFTAVLTSPRQYGIGGYAEMVYGIRSKSLEYKIRFDGLFNSKRRKQEYFVTIEKRTGIVHQMTRRARRRKKNKKLRGIWVHLDKKSRKLIAKTRLRMRVTSKGGTTVLGRIIPTGTCGAYIGVMSSGEALIYPQVALSSAGYAILDVHDNGRISYNITLKSMQGRVTYLTIETLPTKTGRRTVIYNLSGQFQRNSTTFDGFAIGTIKNLRAKYIALLVAGRLFVNVETNRKSFTALRGRIENIQYSDNIDYVKNPPSLLMSQPQLPTGVAGLVWIAPDTRCRLHYQIILSGLRDYSSLTALLVGDFDSRSTISSNTIYTIIISNFVNGMAHGVIFDMISAEVFKSLDAGTSFLQMGVTGIHKGQITGNLSMPNSCWSMPRDQGKPLVTETLQRVFNIRKGDCKSEGKTYRNDDSWVPSINGTCRTCSCKAGTVVCHDVICPALKCTNQVRVDGECCPACPDTLSHNNGTCFYEGDKRHYRAGAVWYPYIPHSGYSTCVTCRCDANTIEVNCSRSPCPVLKCPKSSMIRLHKDDCCQTCLETKHLLDIMHSTAPPNVKSKSKDGACHLANKVYKNKSRWHPTLNSIGIVKCVICKCKLGEIKCKRTCKKSVHCKDRHSKKNKCCNCYHKRK